MKNLGNAQKHKKEKKSQPAPHYSWEIHYFACDRVPHIEYITKFQRLDWNGTFYFVIYFFKGPGQESIFNSLKYFW